MPDTLFDATPYRAQPRHPSDVDRIAEVLARHPVQEVTVQRLHGARSWWECSCDWQTAVSDPGNERAQQAAEAAAYRHQAEQVVEALRAEVSRVG